MEKQSFHYAIKLVTITMLMGIIASMLLFYLGLTKMMILTMLAVISIFVVGIYLNQLRILRHLNRMEIDELKSKNPYPTL